MADLLRQLDEKKWPAASLDLGGTVHRDRLQSQFKFSATLKAMKDLRYSAMALGTEELRLEQSNAGYLASQFEVDPKLPRPVLPFLAANVILFGDPNFGVPAAGNVNVPVVARTHVFTTGTKKVGVTAVFGKSFRTQIL